jgi:hypothetical protein
MNVAVNAAFFNVSGATTPASRVAVGLVGAEFVVSAVLLGSRQRSLASRPSRANGRIEAASDPRLTRSPCLGTSRAQAGVPPSTDRKAAGSLGRRYSAAGTNVEQPSVVTQPAWRRGLSRRPQAYVAGPRLGRSRSFSPGHTPGDRFGDIPITRDQAADVAGGAFVLARLSRLCIGSRAFLHPPVPALDSAMRRPFLRGFASRRCASRGLMAGKIASRDPVRRQARFGKAAVSTRPARPQKCR